MDQAAQPSELGPFQLAVFALSVFVLAVLGVELVVPLDAEITRVIGWVDDAVCILLLVDFAIRFRRAESKLEFMRWGWVDLLASIPAIESLRFGRALRVFRVLRLIRAVRSIRALLGIMFESRARGGVVSVTTVTFLLVAISSVAILLAEKSSGGNIDSADDAVWWSLATITTVGYGDVYPVTLAGRAIASVLMVAGVGLFGTLSGTIASVVVGLPEAGDRERAEPREPGAPLRDELLSLRREVAALRGDLAARDRKSEATAREPAE